MNQTDLVFGFSELKSILIRTYGIDRPRNEIKLFFTQAENELLMHDNGDHSKVVTLSRDIVGKTGIEFSEKMATAVIQEALEHEDPVDFLQEGFLSHGFFIS